MKFVPMKMVTQAKWLRRGMNLWPPFIGAGIKVTHIADDFKHARVLMRLGWYNRNYMGTQYGGSLYSMTDAFYAIMIIRNLDNKYYVWDKSASIDYIAPAKGTVYANYILTDEMLDTIKQNTDDGQKFLYELPVEILDDQKQLIAKVNKIIYIRKKAKYR